MLFNRQNQNNKCNCGCMSHYPLDLSDKLREAMCGKSGEMFAVLTYLFQLYNTDNIAIKDALKEIAEDEMEHLNKLALLLLSLKETPYYVDGYKNFYTTKWVDYETNPNVFLPRNIMAEKDAIRYYNEIIESTENEYVISVIKEIIEDEKRHIEILKRLQGLSGELE